MRSFKLTVFAFVLILLVFCSIEFNSNFYVRLKYFGILHIGSLLWCMKFHKQAEAGILNIHMNRPSTWHHLQGQAFRSGALQA